MTRETDCDCTTSRIESIDEAEAVELANQLKALADPLRLRIVAAIHADARGESCVCDLTELADVAQPTFSHHLKQLRDAGLLESERRGTWVWYRIPPARHDEITTLVAAITNLNAAKETNK